MTTSDARTKSASNVADHWRDDWGGPSCAVLRGTEIEEEGQGLLLGPDGLPLRRTKAKIGFILEPRR